MLAQALLDERLWTGVSLGIIDKAMAQRCRVAGRLLLAGPVSGEVLGRSLGISRAAVHKHVVALRGLGFNIQSSRGVGHVVEGLPEALIPEAVVPLLLSNSALPAPGDEWFLGLPYIHQQEVSSTNDVCRRLAESGAASGAVVVAEGQAAGRGRLARRWYSEPGLDVTCSLLLRPEIEPAALALVILGAAWGIARFLAEDMRLGRRVSYKWPNDVLVDGRKVCGILTEASSDMDRVWWVVAGVGINVNGSPSASVPRDELPADRGLPVSLREVLGHSVDRHLVLRGVIGRLGEAWRRAARDPATVVRALRSFDCLLGRRVTLSTGLGGRELVRGRSEGIGEDGLLRVRTSDGRVRSFASGEVTLRSGGDPR